MVAPVVVLSAYWARPIKTQTALQSVANGTLMANQRRNPAWTAKRAGYGMAKNSSRPICAVLHVSRSAAVLPCPRIWWAKASSGSERSQ